MNMDSIALRHLASLALFQHFLMKKKVNVVEVTLSLFKINNERQVADIL
jgi:hypothetical protein